MLGSNNDIATRLRGSAYAPGDAGYAEHIAGFNTAIVHAPELVVVPESVDDVVEVIRFAREHHYQVAVQCTGHGAHVPSSAELLVSTRRLGHVMIDPASRTATIGGGARWDAVVAAAAEHGLAPITGSSTSVGVVGYILGGGLGPLARSHGFSSDYLISMTVVTGAGEVVVTSEEQDPELFWGLRGGGRIGLGIVVELRLRLVELPQLYAGALMFDETEIETALLAWVDWTADADPQVSTSVAIVRFPPLPAVPAPFRGRRLLALRFAYPGAAEDGARLAAPLRSAAPVYLDSVSELPAAEIAAIHNDPTDPRPAWSQGALLTHVDHQLVATLLAHVGAGTNAPFTAIELRHLGAAAERDVAAGSSVGGRIAGFTLGIIAGPPAERFAALVPGAAQQLLDEVRPWIAEETNINWASPRSVKQLASLWSEPVFEKLGQLRRRYDPDGVLSLI